MNPNIHSKELRRNKHLSLKLIHFLHKIHFIPDRRPASCSNGQSLTTDHEVPGSIPGSTLGIFLWGEDPRGDHGLGS